MKFHIIVYLTFLLVNVSVLGQNDPAAVNILDKFSSNALSAPSVSMKFMLITTDQTENTTDTLNGSIILNKDKYKLYLPDNIIWFNGESSWSYLTAEKEVTISKPDKKDNSFQNHPSAIFSLYKKGYKSRLIEERPSLYVIDLYPEDTKNDLVRIRLSIGKSLMDLRTLEYKRKDGVLITLKVLDYSLRQKTDASTFIFQPAKFKGVEIIDIR
jgi:outer membrane lipoprotein carrier protein